MIKSNTKWTMNIKIFRASSSSTAIIDDDDDVATNCGTKWWSIKNNVRDRYTNVIQQIRWI